MKTVQLEAALVIILFFGLCASSFGANYNSGLCYPFISLPYSKTTETPTAVNDTFIMAMGCGNYILSENILQNDSFHPDSAWLSNMTNSENATISYDAFGNFVFRPVSGFRGEISFEYILSSIYNSSVFSKGTLTLFVEDDFDCDNVIDRLDLDIDNDGIINFHEGDEDTDGDGIANCYDIDSDNDGITDYIEWQKEGEPLALLLCDQNCDGWDDAFDSHYGGEYYKQVDTDMDGTPDFLDTDSDNDGFSDFIEAYDVERNNTPTISLSLRDDDNDGLDNACDTIARQSTRLNAQGGCSPLPDHNANGIRDWREEQYIIVEEDIDIPNALTTDLQLYCYPSPFINTCTLVLPKLENNPATEYSLSIFDTRGNMVYLEKLYKLEKQLSLGHLKQGIYIVRVKMGAQVLSYKLIKSV